MLAKDNIENWELALIKQFELSFEDVTKKIVGYPSSEIILENSDPISGVRKIQSDNLVSDFVNSLTKNISNLTESLKKLSFQLFRGSIIEDNSSNNLKKNLSEFKEFINKQKNKLDTDSKKKYLEIYPIWLFCISAFLCMFLSTIFHIFFPLSKKINKALQRLDHAGISILNFGSSYSIFFYFFYCEDFYRTFYSIFISVACFSVFFISLLNAIHRPENTKIKSLMYALLGLSNIIPFVHLSVLASYATPLNSYICLLYTSPSPRD